MPFFLSNHNVMLSMKSSKDVQSACPQTINSAHTSLTALRALVWNDWPQVIISVPVISSPLLYKDLTLKVGSSRY